MSKILNIPQDNYRIKVQDRGVITLDTGSPLGVINTLGMLSVSGITDYDLLVTDPDHIPNKKYVDKAIAESLRSRIIDGTTILQVHDLGVNSDLVLTLNGSTAVMWTTSGMILYSPIGIRYKLAIANDGTYTITTVDSLIGLILASPDGTRYGLSTTDLGVMNVVTMTPDPFPGATIKTTSEVFEITTPGSGLLMDSPDGTVFNHYIDDTGSMLIESYSSETIADAYVIEITTPGEGITLLSPYGTKYKITVADGGFIQIGTV